MMASLDKLRTSHRRVMGRYEVIAEQRERYYERELHKIETKCKLAPVKCSLMDLPCSGRPYKTFM
jgi:hypothetical protein